MTQEAGTPTTIYRYAVKYVVVSEFGDILWGAPALFRKTSHVRTTRPTPLCSMP